MGPTNLPFKSPFVNSPSRQHALGRSDFRLKTVLSYHTVGQIDGQIQIIMTRVSVVSDLALGLTQFFSLKCFL